MSRIMQKDAVNVYDIVLGFGIMISQMDLNMYELYLGGVEGGIRNGAYNTIKLKREVKKTHQIRIISDQKID